MATLPTHGTCNRSYSLDEEYFVATLALIAEGSPTAIAVMRQHAAKLRAGKARALGFKILKQFEERPSSLYLPRGLVAMRLEGDRISRVAWKIVRGLYRIETGDILWEDTPYHLELIEPENRDQARSKKLWEAVKGQPSKGRYGASRRSRWRCPATSLGYAPVGQDHDFPFSPSSRANEASAAT